MSYNETLLRGLTQGKLLPFEPIADPLLILISEGIRSAWKHIVSRDGKNLPKWPEKELNASLVIEFNNIIQNDPVLKGIVSSVVRGSESIDVTGRHIELQPDINIYLHNRNSNYPLIGECKIINSNKYKTVRLYRKYGISRFIDGKYSWYNREGFMVGYVMDRTSVSAALTDKLGNPLEWPLGGCAHRCKTVHHRRFQYPVNVKGGRRPGSISLFHLWLEP